MRRPLYFFVLLLLTLPILAQAQSGCCSSHGGVCGCACCDGTNSRRNADPTSLALEVPLPPHPG